MLWRIPELPVPITRMASFYWLAFQHAVSVGDPLARESQSSALVFYTGEISPWFLGYCKTHSTERKFVVAVICTTKWKWLKDEFLMSTKGFWTLAQGHSLLRGCRPVHCMMFSNIPGFYPLDPSGSTPSTPPLPAVVTMQMSPDVAKCPRGGKFVPVEKHWPGRYRWDPGNFSLSMHLL